MRSLYDSDFYAWTQAQADALRRRSANEFDWDNLLEEIADLGRREVNELRNRLCVLLTHLFKWDRQVSHRSASWARTIREQRRQVAKHLDENPSLKATIEAVFEDAYASAIVEAIKETGLAESVFRDARRLSWAEALSGQIDELDTDRASSRATKA